MPVNISVVVQNGMAQQKGEYNKSTPVEISMAIAQLQLALEHALIEYKKSNVQMNFGGLET